MKQRGFCITCKKKVKPDSTTEFKTIETDSTEIIEREAIHKYSCPICKGEINSKDVKLIQFTMKECLKVAKCLQDAKPHADVIGKIDMKIGDLKKCNKCGRITDVVGWTGCMEHDSNCSSTCEVCEVEYYRDDLLPDECYSNVEEKTFYKNYKETGKILNKVFEVAPPKNDSILEFERIVWFVFHLSKKKSTLDIRNEIFDRFICKCGELGLITK